MILSLSFILPLNFNLIVFLMDGPCGKINSRLICLFTTFNTCTWRSLCVPFIFVFSRYDVASSFYFFFKKEMLQTNLQSEYSQWRKTTSA